MANLVTGTITFLFTDIEGSSRLWERYPRAMPGALARHDAILGQAIAAQGGVVFKTVGDGYHAAFGRAIDAVAAALDCQRALAAEAWEAFELPGGEALLVRMAIHAGAAEQRDGDYFGPTLNRVARLMDAGHGGQVLLSRAAADLVHDQLPPGVTLRDLGPHDLRQLSHPEQIFQLVAPDLPAPLRPLRATPTQSAPRGRPPLLKTKLTIPPARASLVRRPRLLARLAAVSERKLTLISAPPGFGKTTLLTNLFGSELSVVSSELAMPEQTQASSLKPQNLRAVWLSLDDGDNDPTRFWTYVAAALEPLSSDASAAVQALLHSPQPLPIEAVLTELINAAAGASQDVVLVLDDYHVIATPAIHSALTFLIDHLPPRLHLAITSRTDPLLPLARWRARGDLLELRAADLRFTADEAATFLRESMGLALGADAIALLEARTEGWIAGLQLAALSLQGQDNAADFISAFAGSHRHVADYLTEEVLQRQPAHLKTFLLQTAILDRLCGPLCDAVLGLGAREVGRGETPQAPSPADSYSRLILAELERAHLFLVPLDQERQWYRYHHLFADVLRYRLRQDQPERIATLHRRAAAWFEGHDLLAEALEHARAAGDDEHAARLAERMGPLRALARGEGLTVKRWLDQLPEPAIRARPILCLARARVLQRSAPAAVVEQWLQDTERGLARHDTSAEPGADSAATIRGEIAALRAHMATAAGDVARAIEQCRVALDSVPAEDAFARAALQMVLGGALQAQGHYDAAYAAFGEAAGLGRASGNARATLMSLCNQGLIHVARGQLPAAAALYREAMRLSGGPGGQPLPAAQGVYRLLGDLLREWNDLDGAERMLVEATAIAERHRLAAAQPMTYSLLAQVQQARGQSEAAIATMQRAQAIVREHNLAREERVIAAKEAEVRLRAGDLDSAARWAAAYSPAGGGPDRLGRPRAADIPLVYARVRLAQGRPEQAIELLGPPASDAEREGRADRAIELLALLALAHAASGDMARALDRLGRALALAEPGGYVRVFVDEGAPMAGLLARSAEGKAPSAPLLPYIERLLQAFPQAPKARDARPGPQPQVTALADPLTERELEVLRLVAAGMSSPEIAQHFVVSINTVKTQIKSIYGKLDAHSRSEAIAKARALHLLR